MSTAMMRMGAQLFVPKGLKSKKKPKRSDSRRAPDFVRPQALESQSSIDCEAPRALRRNFMTVGVHNMDEGEYDRGFDDDGGSTDETTKFVEDDPGELQKIEEAKQRLRDCGAHYSNGAQIMHAIDWYVRDDWLGIESLPGNMYRVWAFNGFKVPTIPCLGDEEHSGVKALNRNSQFAGTLCIMVIQLVGAPIIIMSIVYNWGAEEELDFNKWNNFSENKEWEEKKLTRLLGLLFLFCFIVNGMKVTLMEKESFDKVWRVYNVLGCRRVEKGMHSLPLLIGPFVNCWVTITCCIAVFLIMGISGNAKDVVFDALGITFLFNLDDIGGDMAFVGEEDWPGERLQWIWSNLVGPDKDDDEDEEDPPPCIMSGVYWLTYGILVLFSIVLPILYIMIPWSNLAKES